MPTRDGAATRQRILDAAVAEFAGHGLAGARVERIAERAAANPKTLYTYFASKDELFDTVVLNALDQVHTAVPFTPDDLPGYAGALFDFIVEHPALVMVDAWRRLERPTPTEIEQQHFRDKVDALRQVNTASGPDGTYDAVDILVMVTAITAMWFTAPRALTELTTRDLPAMRDTVTTTVSSLTQPNTSEPDRPG